MTQIKNNSMLVFFILFSLGAGMIGSFFTFPSIEGWYATLVKPDFVPPNQIFGPVWTILYVLMGIAAFLVWKSDVRKKESCVALTLFVFQLILNVLWSLIFFGLHAPGAAFIEIVFLWLSILAMIIVFARISRSAAALLVPYIAWVSFASYLNYSIWILNA